MINLFKNTTYFTIFYFTIVIISLLPRFIDVETQYALLINPINYILLIIYYYINAEENIKSKRIYIVLGLIFFFVAEMFFSYYERISASAVGILLYVVGKLLYCGAFSNDRELNSKIIIRYLIIIFIIIIAIMSVVYMHLKEYLLPVLVYLFASVFMSQYALMRKNEVNTSSYLYVIAGIYIFIFVDCLASIRYFYLNYQYIPQSLIILLYAIAQYSIIIGIVKKKPSSIINKMS